MTDHAPVCAECWRAYEHTSEGIRRHQFIEGHRPSPKDWPVAKLDGSRTATNTTGRTK